MNGFQQVEIEHRNPAARQQSAGAELIRAKGEMADRVRALDWGETPFGPIKDWPETLLTIVNMMLGSAQPMFLFWGDDLVQVYNDAYRPSIGADKHPQALGQRASECWTEIWDSIHPQIVAVMERGETTWHENQLLPMYRNGVLNDVYWTYSYSPVWEASGRVSGVMVVCMETTGRVQAERARDAVTAQYQQILDATTDSVLGINRDWRITYMNKPARRDLERMDMDFIGRHFWETFPDAVYEGSPFLNNYTDAMENGVSHNFEAFYPDPLNIWVRVEVRPSADGIVLFFRDITENKRAHAVLIQTEKLAAVGRLATSIAHEINNPLESVTNLLYLARRTKEPGELDNFLDLAERELRRVAVISNQTLRFHKQTTDAQPMIFDEVLEGTLSVYQGRLVNSHVQVQLRLRATKPVVCFEGEIRQVVSNLVGNAIDAMGPNGGTLHLRTRTATNWRTGQSGVALTIADTGSGMSKATRERIFEAFFTTKGIGGTGLGLWVSREIVDRHQGALNLRTTQLAGRTGTAFCLFLPYESQSRLL